MATLLTQVVTAIFTTLPLIKPPTRHIGGIHRVVVDTNNRQHLDRVQSIGAELFRPPCLVNVIKTRPEPCGQNFNLPIYQHYHRIYNN